jgi:hypothetical protein
MSRGFGIAQRWLLSCCIDAEPMTFEQILARAFPDGTFEGDMTKTIGGSNVGKVRSLRRALRKLCDDGVIQMMIGRRLHHYRLHPLFVRERAENNPKLIWILCQILKAEAAEKGVSPPVSPPV